MHQFICKAQEGRIVPLEQNKVEFLYKLLNSYQDLNKKFKVTIELIEKNINENQVSLYMVFVMKASKHFGNTYEEMREILKAFHPICQDGLDVGKPKPVYKWTSSELQEFLDKASALLSEYGFKFD